MRQRYPNSLGRVPDRSSIFTRVPDDHRDLEVASDSRACLLNVTVGILAARCSFWAGEQRLDHGCHESPSHFGHRSPAHPQHSSLLLVPVLTLLKLCAVAHLLLRIENGQTLTLQESRTANGH